MKDYYILGGLTFSLASKQRLLDYLMDCWFTNNLSDHLTDPSYFVKVMSPCSKILAITLVNIKLSSDGNHGQNHKNKALRCYKWELFFNYLLNPHN